ncbi:NAD(P)-dependent alcohol dehydrogenase [Streptomyces sp. NPDC102279]|uniref:NAD(P)-dependent alcohol dehydrogenase n=1 Tax=Streptomyces sp. NPDC102279 TaxID=3366153 RepID=UPI0037F1FD8B
MKIRAAVTRSKGSAFEIEELELDDPKAGEIIVRIVGAGICHSDLSARDQYVPLALPAVLGHEGAGIVESVGPDVTKVAPGDHVVLTRMACGVCHACKRGDSNVCEKLGVLNAGGPVRADGSTGLSKDGEAVNGQFFGQSSFATYAMAHESNAVKIAPDFDLTLAPAFACGVLTGAGTVINGLHPSVGSTIAVFGVGGVGLAAILAARAAGSRIIVAVDRHQNRLDLALELGATHTILAGEESVSAAVHAIVPGGVQFSVEATGVPSVARAAVESVMPGGECALLGVGPVEQDVTFNHMQVALSGITVRGYPSGLSEPDILIPQLIDLYEQGRFPVDRLLTRYDFEQIEEAVQDAASGAVIKPVLVFD